MKAAGQILPDQLKISVITPSFNQAQFIEQTIASVLEQRYPALEYLVMDGGSTDGTLDVLRRHEKQLRWVSEPDRGQAAAINKGWRQSRGEIVAWLNSDDTYLPGALDRVAAFFQAHPDVEAVYGNCDYIDQDGRLIRPYPARPYNYLELVRAADNYIPQPATFVRRRAIEAVGYLDESLHYALDFDYWLRLGVRHTLAYLPERLATLRLHQSAKSVCQVGEFAPELVAIYQQLFARPDLPAPVRAIRSEAMSNVCYKAAGLAFWSGHIRPARCYGFQAWRYRPFRFRRLLLLLMSGKVGLKIAERLRINPLTADGEA